MSEETREEHKDGLEVTYRIPVERFDYEDELKRKNEKLEKRNQRLQTLLVILVVCALLGGWIGGSFHPLSVSGKAVQNITVSTNQIDADKKISSIMRIMENYWYFAKDIENLEERLTDQALIGMTTNEEDPHTTYMTKEEITAFSRAINRNYVGIGVQFQSLEDGLHLVTKVFRNSPAEKAGVQAGDIIHSVNGEVVDDYTASQIKELVQGEEGTSVNIGFLREGKLLSLDIVRGQVAHTVDSKATDEGFGLLLIEQFGETTAVETKDALDEFEAQGVKKLIIDLRDNGGGYLDALQGVMSCFLPANTVVINRDYSNGTKTRTVTDGGMYTCFDGIAILINDNTASAAEAFTIAMKEQRDDVMLIGTTSYGKGSVQINQYYEDGSAFKYTDSIWKSPNGVWINGKGIEPDYPVELHEVLNSTYYAMEDGETCAPDSISEFTREFQLCLDFLGYEIDRTDGYFSQGTLRCLHQFEKDYELEQTDVLNSTVYEAAISAVIRAWGTDETYDTQYQKAIELLKGCDEKTEESTASVFTEQEALSETGTAVMFEAVTSDTLRSLEIETYGQI